MGKTKTAVVGGITGQEVSGRDAYEEKKRKKLEQEKLTKEKEKKQVSGVGLKGGERIRIIGEDIPEVDAGTVREPSETAKTTATKAQGPKLRGKKYKSAIGKVDQSKLYSLTDGIKLVKESSYSKFDGSVELHLTVKKVGLSARVELPHSAGKAKKIEIADDKTIEKLKSGKIDFDTLLATAEMMPKLVAFAKLLGPKGLMPNPKNGTIIKSEKDGAKFSGNTLNIKTEKEAPVIHTTIGKVSQKNDELVKNLETVIQALDKKLIVKAYLKATMGPSIKLQI